MGSIYDSYDIHAIDKILASPVNSPVQYSRIFNYVSASDPLWPPYDSSAESETHRVNTKTRNNPPNLVTNVPSDPYSDQSLSYSSLSESYDSSEDGYYKQKRRAKNDKNKCRSKMCFDDPIKKCTKLTAKLLTAAYKSKVITFKLDEDPLQCRGLFPILRELT